MHDLTWGVNSSGMKDGVSLRVMILYMACRTALLLLGSTVYTCIQTETGFIVGRTNDQI